MKFNPEAVEKRKKQREQGGESDGTDGQASEPDTTDSPTTAPPEEPDSSGSEQTTPDKHPLPEVHRVIGAPGTGKTTRVVGNPELEDHTSLVMENAEEYPFEDQFICTYTKAATEEAADRLQKVLDEPKYMIEDRVRTIHSACFNALGLKWENVVKNYHKQNFCKYMDMEYGWESDEDDILSGDSPEGNQFFDIFNWLLSNRKTIGEYEDCPKPWEGDQHFIHVADKWVQWKEEKDLVDFVDMIDKTVEQGRHIVEEHGLGELFPDDDMSTIELFEKARDDPTRDPEKLRGRGPFIDTKVLYVDEVQDLNPLQWSWYLMQKLVAEKVYIGGDDDQTIYGWAGANPDFMLDEEGSLEVLDKTYRIPRNVWDTCDGVVHKLDRRQDKAVEPHGDGGEVITMENPEPSRVLEYARDGETFILFRARYMINDFTEDLHEAGIPYTNMSTFETWTDDIVTLRDALYKVDQNAEYISGDEFRVMQDYANDEIVKTADEVSKADMAFGNLSGIEMEIVDKVFGHPSLTGRSITPKGFLKHCDEVNYYQTQAILGSIEQGTADLTPDQVRIGTIHSSKGKEAETVILALDSTKTIMANMADDTLEKPGKFISDAERRVYYVGMTRASERLVLAEGVVDSETTLQLRDLLDDYEPEAGTSAQPLNQGGSGSWE